MVVSFIQVMQNWGDKVHRGTILRCFVSQWSPLKWLCEQTVTDKTERHWSALTHQVRYIVELAFQSILFLIVAGNLVACPLSPLTKYESQQPAYNWGIEYRWPWTKIIEMCMAVCGVCCTTNYTGLVSSIHPAPTHRGKRTAVKYYDLHGCF